MQIEEMPIKDIVFAEYNPRKLTPEQEQSLLTSLASFGFVDPVIINRHPTRKNILIGGHQRVKVWQRLGHDTVPAVFVELELPRERELNIRLNKNTGEWDWGLLEEFFIKDELLAWGFTTEDLHGRFKRKTIGDDEHIPLPAEPKTKQGDVYLLGPHSLICGDATDTGTSRRVCGGVAPDMIFTDPPYNVNYSGRGKETDRTIENDNLDQTSFRTMLRKAFMNMAGVSRPQAPVYCCHASRTQREFEDCLNEAGYQIRNQIIWVKKVSSMGWGDYRWKHEPMFYATQMNQSPEFYAGRKEMTAWDDYPTDQELLDHIKKLIHREEDGQSTVWRFSRDYDYKHPTQKPVALVSRAIINSSKKNGIVYDPFAGSGTTLIAAEKEDRRAILIELEPGFCDVIVTRYVKFCRDNQRPFQVIKNNIDITGEFVAG